MKQLHILSRANLKISGKTELLALLGSAGISGVAAQIEWFQRLRHLFCCDTTPPGSIFKLAEDMASDGFSVAGCCWQMRGAKS